VSAAGPEPGRAGINLPSGVGFSSWTQLE